MSNMVGPTSPLLYYYHPDRRPFEKLPLAKGKNIFYFNPDDKNFSGVVDIKDGGFNMPEVSHRYYQSIPPSPKTMAKNKEAEKVKEEPKRKPTEHELRDPVKKEKPKPRILPKPDFSKKNARSSLDQERRPRFIKFSPQGKVTDTAEYVEIQQPNDEPYVAESPIVAMRRNITHSLPDDFGDDLFNEDGDSDVISTCSSVSTLSEEENVPPYKPHLNDDVFGPGLNMREIKPPSSTKEREKVFKQRGSSDTFLVSSISCSVSSSEAEDEDDEKKGPPKINQEETSTFKSTRVFQRQDALSSSEVGKTDSEGPEDVRYAVLKFQDFSDIENYNSEGNDSGFVRKIARLSNSMSDLTSIDSSFDKSIEDEKNVTTIERRDNDDKKGIVKEEDENKFRHCPYCSLEDENTCDSGIGDKNTKSEEKRKHNDKGLLKTVDQDTNKMQSKIKQKPETDRNMVFEETIKADILSIQKTDREFKFDEPVKEKPDLNSLRKEKIIKKKNNLMDKVIDVNKNDMYGELRVDINFDDDIDGGIRYDKNPCKTDNELNIVGESTKPHAVDIDVSSRVIKVEKEPQKEAKSNDKTRKLKYVKEKERRPRMIFQDTFDLSTSDDGAEKNNELEKSTKLGDIVIATKDVVLNVNYPSEKKQANVKRNNSFESNEDIRKWIQDQIKHFKTIQIELDESSDEKSKQYVEKVNQRRQQGNNIKKKAKFFEDKEKEEREGELEEPGSESNDLEKMMFIKEYVQNIIEDMLRKKKDEEEKEKIQKEELEKRRKDEVKSEQEPNDIEKLEFIKEYVRGIVENVVVERRKELILNKIDLENPKKPVEVPTSLDQLKKADDTKDDLIRLNAIGQYIQDLIDNVIKTRWDELSKNIASDVIGEVGDVIENVIDDLVKTKADDDSSTENELLKLKDVPLRTVEPIASKDIKEETLDKSNYVPSNIHIEDKEQNDNLNAMVIPCVNPSVDIHVIDDEKDNETTQKTREDKELIVEEIKDVITLEKTFHENDDILRKLDEADEEEKRKAEEESIDRNAVNEYVRNLINDVINDRYNEICEQQVTDIPLSDDYHGDESNNETDLEDLPSLSVGNNGEYHPDGQKNKKSVDDDGTYFHFMDTENDDIDKEQYFFESDDETKKDQCVDGKVNAKNEESGIDTKSEDFYLDDNAVPNDGLFIKNIDTGEVIPINEIKEEKLMDQNLSRSDVILDLTNISDEEQKGKDEDLDVDLDIVSSPKTLMQEMIDSDLPLLQSADSPTSDPKPSTDNPECVTQPSANKRPKVNRKSLYRKLSATFYNPCEDIFRQAEVMADAMERYRGFKHIHDDSRTYENIVRWKDELIESFHKRNFGIL